jgi:hypothetical protein
VALEDTNLKRSDFALVREPRPLWLHVHGSTRRFVVNRYIVLYKAPVSVAERFARATKEEAMAGLKMWIDWAQKLGSALVEVLEEMPAPQLKNGGQASRCCGSPQ